MGYMKEIDIWIQEEKERAKKVKKVKVKHKKLVCELCGQDMTLCKC